MTKTIIFVGLKSFKVIDVDILRNSFLAISAQFTLEMRVAAQNREKFTNPSFLGSESFKVINVDIPKKLVASACYDKQHFCAYLQPFSR